MMRREQKVCTSATRGGYSRPDLCAWPAVALGNGDFVLQIRFFYKLTADRLRLFHLANIIHSAQQIALFHGSFRGLFVAFFDLP
jgi:hypothetical protein